MNNKEIKNIIASHHNDGSCQSQNFTINNQGYILLTGFYTLKNHTWHKFKRGWYNLSLKFIRELTELEELELCNTPPF